MTYHTPTSFSGQEKPNPSFAEIEVVARAIHAADRTHCDEKWSEVKALYRNMAVAAIEAQADLREAGQ